MTKRFHMFQLDVANQSLWRGKKRVALMPKPFAVLIHLVEHAGRLVSRDELLHAVWPNTHVQPDVLRKHIKEIRRVLGDQADTPRFIETLPKRGYRFIPSVDDEFVASTLTARAPQAPLIGRASALASLNASLRTMLGGDRQIVFVVGEPGIGKTSVVDAFEREAAAVAAVHVVCGRAIEGFGGKEPYYPVLDALGRLGRTTAGPFVVGALARHAPTWMIQLPSLVAADRRSALAREVVGAARERMVRELCEALEVISAKVPLVLILEDLHWADDSTFDVLSAIARRREPARLLLIGTCRPVEAFLPGSAFKRLRHDLIVHGLAHEIALPRLDLSEVAQHLAVAFTPNEWPAGLATLIHRHSDGNPLFMSTTLDHLITQGVLVRQGPCWRMALPLDQIDPGVPDTLRGMLELQLDRLTDEERWILMCASVAGARFTIWSVATMLATNSSCAEAVCHAVAARGQFLTTRGTGELRDGEPTTQYEFRHALYRDVLYRRLPPDIRVTYHRRLAEGLEAQRPGASHDIAAELATHYEEGRDHHRAIACLMTAAENATRRYAHRDAASLLTHARELTPRLATDARGKIDVTLLQRIGDAHYAHAQMTLAADAFEAAARCAADAGLPAAGADAWMRVARAAVFDVDHAIESCERAARIGATAAMPALEARGRLLALCWRLLHHGWSRPVADMATELFRSLRRSDDEIAASERILYAHVQMFRSEYRDACANAEAARLQLSDADTLWEHLAAVAAKAAALSYLGCCGDATSHRGFAEPTCASRP